MKLAAVTVEGERLAAPSQRFENGARIHLHAGLFFLREFVEHFERQRRQVLDVNILFGQVFHVVELGFVFSRTR